MPVNPYDPFNQYGTPGPKGEPEGEREDGGVFFPPGTNPAHPLNRRQFLPEPELSRGQKRVDAVTSAIQRNQVFRHGSFTQALRYTFDLDPLNSNVGALYRASALRNLSNIGHEGDHHESRLRGPSWSAMPPNEQQPQYQTDPDSDGGD